MRPVILRLLADGDLPQLTSMLADMAAALTREPQLRRRCFPEGSGKVKESFPAYRMADRNGSQTVLYSMGLSRRL